MKTKGFENLRVYQIAEELSDLLWDIVSGWEQFSKDSVGRQLVRAIDSIGANIAEGAGRRSFQDNRRFIKIARGSLNETRHWLRRAHRRRILSSSQTESLKPLLRALGPMLNAYLKSIGSTATNRFDQEPTTKDRGQRTDE